ncbi:PREDICTED: toll-like receptor 13, partial [Calidris pugnax]|uniref:toll-like receptor 13 n=1 Tax=Calidris pugnax TaxID=198806 RepID=UPI00071D4638
LNLSHNLLPRLPPAAFAPLPRLLLLDLAHNLVATVAPGAFGGLGALLTLNLSHNRLTHLPEGSFSGLGNLTGLLLAHNPLATLSPAAFLPLANLRWLVLRGGRLPALGPVAAAVGHLPNLQLLDLCGNRLSALGPGPPLPPSLLALLLCNNSLGGLAGAGPGLPPPALGLLDLSYNNISRASAFAPLRLGNLSRLLVAGNPLDPLGLLEATDLRPRSLDVSGLRLEVAQLGQFCRRLGATPLRSLRLRRNGLRHLPNGSLAACPPATTLDLTGNRLRRVGCLGGLLGAGGGRGKLREVVIEHNLLRWPPLCSGWPPLPGVRNLSLRFNRIGGLGPGAFAETPRLRLLRLDLNSLARLDPRGLRGLRWLLELRLDNNLLTDLPPGAFSPLRRLETLNLRNNRLSVLFPGVLGGLPHLQTLDLGGNNLRHLGGKALGGLGGLRRLYLDRNRLLEVNAETFQPLGVSLEVLDLGGNALRYRSQRLGQRPPFQALGRLRLLKLQGQRPFGLHIVPQRLFQGLTSLRSLSLAQNGLLAIAADAFDDLGQLEFLTLADSGGGGGDLPAGVFKNLSALRSLDLENMGLRSLGPQVFGNLSRLEMLLLARNQLRGLDKGVATGGLPALRYLDLRKCPLSCACDNAWLPTWLENGPVQVVYLYNYTCSGGSGAYLHNFDTRVCFLDLGLYLFSATSPLVALALALPLLYHRGYWRLRYHLYLLRAWANGRWRPERRRFLYDTFVSYNSADEGWVLGELVPQLEGEGSLRLCLHHRDFRPGRAIVDNIVDAIYNSRKTVCVVSRGFLRSEWCSLEMQLATYRLFEELRDVLVLVFLEPLPEAELSLFHRARRVLLRRTHLRWPQHPQERPLFWAKLIHTLRGGGREEEEEEEEEGGRKVTRGTKVSPPVTSSRALEK